MKEENFVFERSMECWRYFEKKNTPKYFAVSRPGWQDVPISGGGDIDCFDAQPYRENANGR